MMIRFLVEFTDSKTAAEERAQRKSEVEMPRYRPDVR
jgi:hypothetical protein